ncbi:MAG: AAA family ATPase [Paludibacteraceae bacterium]|nr:AAA family ATPase [Paludibacteraceae bacterium]
MDNKEIKQGIELVCRTSFQIKDYYENHNKLVEALNNVPKSELKKCSDYYSTKTGVIVNLRKELVEFLKSGETLTVEILENLLDKHRSGKENQFRAYKQWFSLFYPPITFYGHNPIRDFINSFINQIIEDLKLEGKVNHTLIDFQGARQQGSDRLWFAIYNKEQESQSTGIQFFLDFHNGKVSYGVYRHSDQTFIKERVIKIANEFDYNELINYFKSEVDIILNDTPKNVKTSSVAKIQKDISDNLTENLNVILFGPPGTGKTYELSTNYFNKFTSKQSTVSREEFLKSFIIDKSWWEIIALVLLDIGKKSKVADIFNHEFIQLRASLSNSTTVTPTIWGQLQSHTIESCENVKVSKKGSPLIFNKTNDSYWEIIKEEVNQQAPELFDDLKRIKNFNEDSNLEIRRYEFVTFHQSFTYEDFVEGIKPNFNEGENDLTYKIEDGIFKKMCLKARKDPDQNYAIFIDEINRGNISQIFGELITLIEEDKREGEDNELSVILPYSKTKFSIPTNLYIIGTMNTADRSVEAIDTALRRRFSFVEMPPKPELIKTVGKATDGLINDIDLVELLKVINKRIEKLIDKDHMIGHSYFLNIDSLSAIKKVFKNKILPLLQEYFYGDFGKIGLVLGKGFIEDNPNELDEEVFAQYDEYDSSSLIERKVYRLKDVVQMRDEDFMLSINLLLKK